MACFISVLILYLDVIIDVSIWSTVEPGIGITAASIATLRPVLQTLLWQLGLAPPPSYISARRPIRSRNRRPNTQYRLDWLRPRHQTPDLVNIGSSCPSTTITAALSNTKV
jgi:hypothetical protein